MDTGQGVILLQTLFLSFCWRGLQEALRRLLKDPDAAGSVVSFLHSTLIVCLILSIDGVDSTCLLREATDNSPAQQLLLTTSVSYFLHDTLKSGWIGWRLTMLLHHLGGLFFLSLPLLTGCYAASTLQALLVLEASNPCYHGRRLLRFFGYRGIPYVLLEVLYVITFFYFRFVRATLLTIDVLLNQDYMSPFYILGALFFQTVSVFFMVYIFFYIVNRYVHPNVRSFSNLLAETFFGDMESNNLAVKENQ